ncbi:MAG: sulfite exporter TauE/SafE family protein, partial [Candidatus Korarchaeota archaeon]|nr:sulfite exporter TauE/SafE family protein [Candidatus Korarchaeota archaeon]NIW13116.1 sulfite exporter TauE/SafE family protein [Candidatus Thorarchaeota archaeon]
IGLLGGAHCVGMCGPLVMIYSKNMKSRRFAFVARQHVLLNLGRVTIYMVLGAVSGFAGTILEAF